MAQSQGFVPQASISETHLKNISLKSKSPLKNMLEVKATTGNTKSAKTVLNHPEKYHVGGAIRLGDYNVGRAGRILTLPFYMAFLLTEF